MLNALSQFIFGSANSIFGSRFRDGSKLPIWKDKSLCFDLKPHELETDQGEQLIGCFCPIEDVKGNPDEQGVLKITNLRLIWICCKRKQVNLSIGWHTVTMAFEQNLKDPLGRPLTNLCVLSRYDSTKYEFIFNKTGSIFDSWIESDAWLSQLEEVIRGRGLEVTHLSPSHVIDPFTTVYKVWQCYKQTQIFRQCKSNLTALLTRDTSVQYAGKQCGFRLSELNRLPSEEIVETYTGVEWIESKTTKHVGTLLLTNIRVLWIDENILLRNLSIPYIRIESVKFRQGNDRIMISTCDCICNTTILKFRLVPTRMPSTFSSIGVVNQKMGQVLEEQQQAHMQALYEQLQNLYTIYKSQPRFGPESCDDCVFLMNQLKPIESLSKSANLNQSDILGAQAPRDTRPNELIVNVSTSKGNQTKHYTELKRTYDEQLEFAEEELANNAFGYKFNSYLDERPLSYDKDLIYSKGKSVFYRTEKSDYL